MACMLLSATTFAGNYTWTGTTNSSWTVSTNWSPNGIPGTSDSITINTTTTSLVLTGKKTVKRLTMTNDTLNLGGDTLEITGTAGFNGGLITNGVCYPQATGLLSFAGTTFGSEVKAKGQIKLNGSTFNSTAYFEHKGSAAGTGSGGNTFNGTTTFKNAGTSTFQLAGSNNDTFNGDVYIINASPSGSAYMQLSHGATSYFNGNIEVSSSVSYGVSFSSAGNGASYLANGKTISIGSGGFTGTLLIRNFNQDGNTSQSLSLSGILNIKNSDFEGTLTATTGNLLLSDNLFHNSCTFTKTANSNDYSAGGNHFYENVTFTNNATNTAAMRMASTDGDIFEKDITCNTTTGYIQLAYADTTDIYGNITINNTKANFNSGSGYTRLTGSSVQNLNGGVKYAFAKLIIDKAANKLFCNSEVNVDSIFNLKNGVIKTDSINCLVLKRSVSIIAGGSTGSCILGPVRKVGNTQFMLPLGFENSIRLVTIDSLTNNTDDVQIELTSDILFASDSLDASLEKINRFEILKVKRYIGASNIRVSLTWGSESHDIPASQFLTVSGKTGSTWFNCGGQNISGDIVSGSITSASSGNCQAYTIGTLANNLTIDSIQIGLLDSIGLLSLSQINSNLPLSGIGKIIADSLNAVLLTNNDLFGQGNSEFTNARNSLLNILSTLGSISPLVLDDDFSEFDSLSSGYYRVNGNMRIESFIDIHDTSKRFFVEVKDTLIVNDLSGVFIENCKNQSLIFIVSNISIGNSLANRYGILSRSNVNINGNVSSSNNIFAAGDLNINSSIADDRAFEFAMRSFSSCGNRVVYPPCSPQTNCNFILNPGFNDQNWIPTAPGGVKYSTSTTAVQNWVNGNSTNIATPDYYASNAASIMNVPTQTIGTATVCNTQADNGQYTNTSAPIGYLGIYVSGLAREYIQQHLPCSLSTNTKYYAQFYTVRKDNSPKTIRPLGMAITSNPLIQAGQNVISSTPQVEHIGANITTNADWTIVGGCFSANGGEEYVTIGNFHDDLNSNVQSISINSPGCAGFESHYLIDDVSLVPLSVNAGTDLSLNCSGTVQLGGRTCLTDLDDGQFSYTWNIVSGNSSFGSLSSTTVLNPTLTYNNNSASVVQLVYQVTISTPGGCNSTDDITVTIEPCCTISMTLNSQITCPPSTTGSINGLLSNGTGPYNINWQQTSGGTATGNFNTSNTTFSITSLAPGLYTVIVTDANGCTATSSVTVAVSQLSLSLSASPAAICPGSNSTITANVSNGSAPYSYLWNSGTTSSSLVVNTNGTYTVTVTDANLCSISSNITITKANNPVPASITGSTSACENGGVSLPYAINNPNSGYTYSWSSIAAPVGWNIQSPLTISTTNLISSTTPGTTATITYPVTTGTSSNYILQVTTTDANGCTSTSLLAINGCMCVDPENDYSWTNTSSSVTGPIPSGATVEIHGRYVINTYETWTNVNVVMDAGAEIYIDPWKSLKLVGSEIHPCDYFWKGITIDDGFLVLDNSIIEGAQYAINTKNLGGYNVSNGCELINNYISLNVDAYSYLARIFIGTDIKTNSYGSLVDFNSQSPATCSGATDVPNCGINISDAGVIQIGTANGPFPVTIDDVTIGVIASNTVVKASNILITNLATAPCAPWSADNRTGFLVSGDLGRADISNCRIVNCRVGINCKASVLRARRNEILNCQHTGIILDDPLASTAPFYKSVIDTNSITAGKMGVWLKAFHNYDHHTEIDGNTISSIASTYQFGGGILVNDFPLLFGKALHIANNEIEIDNEFTYGIRVFNTNEIGVWQNSILNLKANNDALGIVMNNCADFWCSRNTVNSTVSNSTSIGIKTFRTSTLSNLYSSVTCNEVSNFQRNFYLEDVNTAVDWAFNKMDGGGVGLLLKDAVLSRDEPWNWWCGSFSSWGINSLGFSGAQWTQNAATNGSSCSTIPSTFNGLNLTFAIGVLTSDPGCDGSGYTPPVVNDGDRFVADANNWPEMDASTLWQFRRLLADKIEAFPEMISSDSTIENFVENNSDLDELHLASLFRQYLQSDTVGSEFSSAIGDLSNHIDSALMQYYLNDSLLYTGLDPVDSLLLIEANETLLNFIHEQQNSLVVQLGLLNDEKNIRKEYLTDLYSAFQPNTDEGTIEQQAMLLLVKYGIGTIPSLTTEDSISMSYISGLCMSDYGSSVSLIRSLYEALADTIIEEDEGCNSNLRVFAQEGEKINLPISFEIRPNPTSTQFEIIRSSAEDGLTNIRIVSLEGRPIMTDAFDSQSKQIFVGGLSSGIYFVHLKSAGVVDVQKLIINR